MKIISKIKILNEYSEVPKNFRQGMVYFIKYLISQSGEGGESFLKRWYSKNIPKPFTFSAYFPLEGKIINGDFFKFIFSTNDPEFIMRIYNGLITLSDKETQLFNLKIKLESCRIIPSIKFQSNTATFKTISPLVVRDSKDHDLYVYPSDVPIISKTQAQNFKYWKCVSIEELKEHIEKNLASLVKYFFNTENSGVKITSLNIQKVVPVLYGSNNKDHPFKLTYPAMKGELTIEAPEKVLELFYDIGIGARRSEGFGMLEVK